MNFKTLISLGLAVCPSRQLLLDGERLHCQRSSTEGTRQVLFSLATTGSVRRSLLSVCAVAVAMAHPRKEGGKRHRQPKERGITID